MVYYYSSRVLHLLVPTLCSSSESGQAVTGESVQSLHAVKDSALVLALCNESSIAYTSGKYSKIGEAMEAAMVVLVEKINPLNFALKGLTDEQRVVACTSDIRAKYSRAPGKVRRGEHLNLETVFKERERCMRYPC